MTVSSTFRTCSTPKRPSVSIQALPQAVGFAHDVSQAAQAPGVRAVDPVPVAHQPVLEGFAEHALHQLAAAFTDDEKRHGGAGKDPQPQQLPVLFPTRLVGIDQLDVAHRATNLLLHHRLDGTPGLVDALIDRCHTELQAQPVVEKLPDACPRQTLTQRQGANKGNQQGAGQVPLGQLDTPAFLCAATPGLCARPMSAPTLALQIGVLGLDKYQPVGAVARSGQVDLVAGGVLVGSGYV